MRFPLFWVGLLLGLTLAACATTPALRSPLRERLASSDTGAVEASARTCFGNGGWKVDPVGGLSSGANVVTASKEKVPTQLYIYPPDTEPRITGGPDYGDDFWSCLEREMGGAKAGGDKADRTNKPDGGQ